MRIAFVAVALLAFAWATIGGDVAEAACNRCRMLPGFFHRGNGPCRPNGPCPNGPCPNCPQPNQPSGPSNPLPQPDQPETEEPPQPDTPSDPLPLPSGSGLDKLSALEKRIADLEKQLAKVKDGSQGPAGPAGASGPAGPPGVAGPAGKDGTDLAKHSFTAQLIDTNGKVHSQTTFGINQPLRLKLVPVAPAK